MARPFDVCVRGGGFTGRTLALLLAKERLRVALVAPAPLDPASGHSDVRAYALNARSRQTLESLRCWPAADHATPVHTMQVHGDRQGEVNFRAADTGAEALAWIVDVPALQTLLNQACLFQPQIEVVQTPLPATLTVVCEGRASASRVEFGVDFEVLPYAQQAIAARLSISQPHQLCARQWFSNDGAGSEILGVLPLDGNSVAIVWSVEEARAQALAALGPEEFAQAVQTASQGAYGGMRLTSERAVWPLQLAQTSRWVGQKLDQGAVEQGPQAWALAGDAAHTVHPLSGQGLNLGLADVAELAQLIGRRDYWRSVADAKLLRAYERSRKMDAALLATATDGLQRLFAQSGDFWQTLRNVGMNSFAGSGALKNWVTRQAMGA